MRRLLLAAAFALIAVAAQAQVDPRYAKELAANAPGSGDQLLPRYAGSFILAQTKKDFDEIVLPLGRTIGAGYASEPDKKLRFEKVTTVEVLETKAMQQNLAFVSAEQIGGALGKDGRVALYGILFDFDKAELKPESDKQLVEMASLLKANAGLKVFIVGHTDNKGTLAYNVDLSQRRAEAVARTLAARYGIAADRMVARGVGPLSPLAPNDREDGQARNRRVELVRQ